MLVGLDLGTTNIKALLVGPDGAVAAEGSAPVERFCTPDGGVEQDIEQIWEATCAAVRQAVAGQDASQIAALGVSSQGAAMQLLDDAGRPVGRVISWLDARGQPWDRRLTEELGEEFFARRIGFGHSALTIGQVLRLREHHPAMLARGSRIGFVGDVIVDRFCGRRAHDPTSLSIAMLLNPRLGRADPDVLARLAIREDQLPDLLPATAAAGLLTGPAAQSTGLPAGIPVSAAIHDQYAALLGAGAVRAGDVCFATGTAWVLLAVEGRLAAPATPQALVCPHPVPGLYGQMLSMVNGGSAVEWVLGLAGEGKPTGAQLDEALQAVPAGSGGLCFWPLLAPHAGLPGAMQRGGRLDGITLGHSASYVRRAVLEGLACELARNLGLLTRQGGPASRLVMYGTAAASRVTPQIIADASELPVACVTQPSVSAFGAAVIARALTLPGAPLAELSLQWAPATRLVHPGKDRAAYRALLRRYLAPFDDPASWSATE